MATKEHKELADFLKEVHSKLRKDTTVLGQELAWKRHCENKDLLKKYAEFMEKLATTHWDANCANDTSTATSRIKWVTEFCYNYFILKGFIQQRDKEIVIAEKIGIELKNEEESHSEPIYLIDVGSCYNPFKEFDYLNVTAIDLCPANDSVLECDFVNVTIGISTETVDGKVKQIKERSFDVVTFCFLLEYIPTSELRIKACENAYNILKAGGLLIVTTPDSKHVGANSKIMKCWQYTLANLGFMRIKYEKLTHMHCMVFRKAICRDTAVRWAFLHQQPYMEHALHIPQDFNHVVEAKCGQQIKIGIELHDFKELPFFE